MNASLDLNGPSWICDSSPLILSDIVQPDKSVSVWQRQQSTEVQSYFEQNFGSPQLDLKRVFSIATLKQDLDCALPDGEGKQAAIDDIYLLCDMLTCLFDCERVGLRLARLTSAMCPNFHVDKITARLVNTYLGEGTQWVPVEAICEQPEQQPLKELVNRPNKGFYQKDSMRQLSAFDVALLKGSAWQGHEHMAAIHRSCPVEQGHKRVVLTLDPI